MPSRPSTARRAAASAASSSLAASAGAQQAGPAGSPLALARAEAAKRLFSTLQAAELPADAVEVASIGDAWGIKGGFKVHAYSLDPEALFTSKRWFIQPKRQRPTDVLRTWLLPISQAKEQGEGIVATSADVPDRTTAEVLKNAAVFVPRASFPTLPEGEFYWIDLIGLAVVNQEGVALGIVTELLTTGVQSVLVMQDASTEPPTERMIPFVDAHVGAVDLTAKRITVDWQPDY